MKKLNILFLTAHKYIPDIFGGMEINSDFITKELIKRGATVQHLCTLKGGFNKRGINHKIKNYFVNNKCDISIDKSLGYPVYVSFNILNVLEYVVKLVDPDVLIIQGGHLYSEIIELACLFDLPIISYFHTPDPLPLNVNYKKLYYVANSDFTCKNHPGKVFSMILPPLINSDDYRVVSSMKYITFINPSPHKGLSIVLKMAESYGHLQFCFVCSSRAQYIEMKSSLSNFGNIKVIKPTSSITDVYCQTKVLLCPSQCNETWGRVASEVQISGIPVLASNLGGLPESVGNGGILLNHDAPIKSWLNALDEILENYSYYSQKSFLRSKRKEICVDHLMDNFIDLMNKISK